MRMYMRMYMRMRIYACIYACVKISTIYHHQNNQLKKRLDPPAGRHSQKVYLIHLTRIEKSYILKNVVFLYENN